ncbi:DUF4270 family protein [Danxiaibacter flavus]|uniref:DUF4270 family protein n=1 Tax=Danxiaibacter flavus TaxID=3049108 RepID=A0ABV3ZQG3_9BACT|nr:DUF4270 family protein [Chitinophagaceae bacterium DXS]
MNIRVTFVKIFVALTGLIALTTACKKVDIQFGQQLVNGYTQVIKTDTFTVNVSSIYTDSFPTNGTGSAVAGIYNDPSFGLVKAGTYLQVVPPGFVDDDTYKNATYDSLEVVLKLNKVYYGDTTKPVQMEVYRLQDSIVLDMNTNRLFNTSSVKTQAAPIGSQSVYLKPYRTDTLSIRLSDALGQELMAKLKTKSQDIRTVDSFLRYFKGINIRGAGNDGLAFGFKDSVSLNLHYTDRGLYPVAKVTKFTMNNSGHQFNSISIDRTGKPLQAIGSSNKEVSSNLSANAGYLQPITGTRVKFTFPSISQLLDFPGFVKLSAAQLVVKPVKGTYDRSIYRLSDSLRLSQTDLNNQQGTDIQINGATQAGNFVYDYQYGQSTSYTYDITTYLQAQMRLVGPINERNGLILSTFAKREYSSFWRTVVGNQHQPNDFDRVQLIIYYIAIQ